VYNTHSYFHSVSKQDLPVCLTQMLTLKQTSLGVVTCTGVSRSLITSPELPDIAANCSGGHHNLLIDFITPSHRVGKPAYLVPVPSWDKLGGLH